MPPKKKKGKKGKAAPTGEASALGETVGNTGSARGSIQDDKSAAGGRASVASSRKPEGKKSKAQQDKADRDAKKRRDEEEKRRNAEKKKKEDEERRVKEEAERIERERLAAIARKLASIHILFDQTNQELLQLAKPLVDGINSKNIQAIKDGEVPLNEEPTPEQRLDYTKTLQEYRIQKLQ